MRILGFSCQGMCLRQSDRSFLLKSNIIANIVSEVAHGNQEVADDEILAIFRRSSDPYLTASEVAEIVGLSRQGAHSRLLDLYERGRVDRKKTGRTVGWWVSKD